MHNRIKNIILRCVDVLSIVLVMGLVLTFIFSQGLILSSVVNSVRVDTYIAPIVGVEIVFLLVSLVWLPGWCLVAYNKRK